MENLMGPFRFPPKPMPWMSILSHGRCTLFSICDMFDLLENEFFIKKIWYGRFKSRPINHEAPRGSDRMGRAGCGRTPHARNIKQYLLDALYNAPATIGRYYISLVGHDLYGSRERR